MEFAVLGLEGLVGSEAGAPSPVSVSHEKVVGSRFGNQERSRPGEDERGSCKVPKTGSDSSAASKAMPLHHGTPLLRSNSVLFGDNTGQHEQMLSFSSLKSDVTFLSRSSSFLDRSSQAAAFPYYHHAPPAYARAAGYGCGSSSTSMHVPFSGVRGPFTPTQWIELEQQALIYKYITANVPVPSNLLISLKKSLYPYGLAYSAGSYPPNSYQWGSFHLGFAGNTDPEPGRCRRTDGKKWRCSRDAVADQKYCERHINRGRHRSRKPVEGQTGQAASGTTNQKVVPNTSMSTSVITSSGASNNLALTQKQFKNLPGAANPSADALVNRVQDSRGVSMMSSTINLKSNESTFSISKQDFPFEESSQSVFGLVTTDSLLNPSQHGSYLNLKNYGGSFLDFNDQETQDQNCLRQFMNDWPKDETNRSVITWPDELKSDLTQLSMSIPVAPSEISSTSSPTPEKLGLSPLRLSREFHPTHMRLGVNTDLVEPTQKQTNWIPVSWGTSMGGPLGEVLTNTTNNVGTYKSSATLNLVNENWDSSPQLGSSPTGVLQMSTFGSLSNSSSGSSPVTENKKTYGGTSLCGDVLGSTLVSSSSIPSL